MPTSADKLLTRVLERIREVRSCDFRLYKKATLRRRIERRMQDRKCSSLEAYLALLQKEPDEINVLVSTILIKVSSFFRDRELWELLRSKILPQIIANKRPGDELRIWSAGCATGEEPYSLAILCADVLGASFGTYPIKVFGTDVDDASISSARRGIYAAAALKNVSEDLRRQYFTSAGDGLTVRKEVRRVVVFGVNDLVNDAPISRIDLLLCRNVFIYLDATLQRRVLARLHYAMRPDGLLLLGKSELIPFAGNLFQPVDLQRRLYRKGRNDERSVLSRERQLLPATDEEADVAPELALMSRFSRDIVGSITTPLVATALDGTIMVWNGAAARLWSRGEAEVLGKKLVGLGLTGLSGDLLVDKTTLVRQGRSEHETSIGVVSRGSGYADLPVAVEVAPLRNASDEIYGFIYRATDMSALRTMEVELLRSNEDRLSAVEELQTTNEELQSSNEELETTNEELQSANEELQTTNEELQSTNEELETTNEELHSTNAELDATNRELAHRTEELNLMSFYQRTLIRSLSAAVVVLDVTGRITIWNLAAERLLGLPEGEALGQLVWSLRIPALKRAQLVRARRSLSQGLALRIDNFAYSLPPGGRGFGNLAAIPIVEGGVYLGAVMLFEDCTQKVVQARELREVKARRPGEPPAAAGATKRSERAAAATRNAHARRSRSSRRAS